MSTHKIYNTEIHTDDMIHMKEEIEKKRIELNNLVSSKNGNLLDAEVIQLSQTIDILLVNYMRMHEK